MTYIMVLRVTKFREDRLTLFDTHHRFAVIAPMIMKFGTGVKLDIFYTMVTKKL